MNKLILLLTGLLYISCVHSQPPLVISPLPLSVDNVETHRVDDSLIRIIRHNMELQPLLEIERISTPEIKLVETLKIDTVTINRETLRFKDSDGAFIETLKVHKGIVEFTLDYYFPRGGNTLIQCIINVNNNKLGILNCKHHKTP